MSLDIGRRSDPVGRVGCVHIALPGVALRRRIIASSNLAKRICDRQQPLVNVVSVAGAVAQLVLFPAFVPVNVVSKRPILSVGMGDLGH